MCCRESRTACTCHSNPTGPQWPHWQPTCWEKVSTVISPRFLRVSGQPSARSAAEEEAIGYSPPTPTPAAAGRSKVMR